MAGAAPSMWPPPNATSLGLERCGRLMPHDNDTGGFFVALFEKTAPAAAAAVRSHSFPRTLSLPPPRIHTPPPPCTQTPPPPRIRTPPIDVTNPLPSPLPPHIYAQKLLLYARQQQLMRATNDTVPVPGPVPQPPALRSRHPEDMVPLVPLAQSGVPAAAQAAARTGVSAGGGALLWGPAESGGWDVLGGGRVMVAPVDMPVWAAGSVAVVELGVAVEQ